MQYLAAHSFVSVHDEIRPKIVVNLFGDLQLLRGDFVQGVLQKGKLQS